VTSSSETPQPGSDSISAASEVTVGSTADPTPSELRDRAGYISTEVRAEMVANVISVVASPEDHVVPGDMLLLLESMKMEIPVLVEAGGVVAEIRVQVGDVVQEGDVLVVLSSPDPRAYPVRRDSRPRPSKS